MKKSHKKIGVVVLTGLAVTGSGLSPTFVAHADSSRLLHQYQLTDFQNKNMDIYELLDIYGLVKKYQEVYKYDAMYLGKNNEFSRRYENEINTQHGYSLIYSIKDANLEPVKQKYFLLKYTNIDDFLKKIKNDLYRFRHHEAIIVKIEDCYFKIFLGLNEHELNTIPVKILARQYGFSVEYASKDAFYENYEFESHIDNRFKDRPYLISKLKQQALIENVTKFKNAEDFAYALKFLYHNIPSELTKYRVGNYDFILKK